MKVEYVTLEGMLRRVGRGVLWECVRQFGTYLFVGGINCRRGPRLVRAEEVRDSGHHREL